MRQFFIACTLPVLTSAVQDVVDLGYATYRGQSDSATGVTTWNGLAFAAPPLGHSRFAPPQPPVTVEGIQNADVVKPACLGVGDPIGSQYSEDCLYLDVFAPQNATPASKLPVFFYIPGGGFVHNDPSYVDGSGLVAASGHSIVVVFARWRVAAYGFLSGEQVSAASGSALNNGIRDQIQALKWTQSQITAFGGDPESVTMGGVSAGAGSIAILLTAYEGKNESLNSLFHAAAGEEPWFPALFTPRQSQSVYENFTNSLNCSGAGSLECLRSRSTRDLQQASETGALVHPGASDPPLYVWGPTIDGELVPDTAYSLLNVGKIRSLPTIFGDDTNGGVAFFNPMTVELHDQADVDRALRAQYPTLTNVQLESFHELYTPRNVPFVPSEAVGGPYYDVLAKEFGDIVVRCPAETLSDVLSKRGAPAWNYIYNISSPRNPAKGAGHGEEASAIFGPNGLAPSNSDNFTAAEVSQIQTYWINFIRFHDPNHNSRTDEATWQSWNCNDRQQLWFESDTKKSATLLETYEQRHRCAFARSQGSKLLQ